jgi:hypothetical protein
MRRRSMGDKVKYYAVVGSGRTVDSPSGIARRTFTADGRLDESLSGDLTWKRSSEIYQWERGENFGPDLVEISAEEAGELIERFRERWGRDA